ncbi:MAG: DUF2254 domain-containing protein [Casimicrobiaceae bacterium]
MRVRCRRLARRVKGTVAWELVYRTNSYLDSALWTVPLIAIVLVLVTVPILRRVDHWLGWQFTDIGAAGATGLYQTVITLALSFLVFTFGSLLVAIQVAGGQLTPRIIATMLLRNNVVRYSVGLFVFALVFGVMALNRQGETVSQIIAVVAAILGIACIANFLFLIDYAARLLRPVSVVAHVGDDGVEVIRDVYPIGSGDVMALSAPLRATLGAPARLVTHVGKAGIVLAVDLPFAVALARRHGGVIEFLPQVGDFVAVDDPLFALYGGAGTIADHTVRETVAFGIERTLEQDPMFAFRILVDIALKALSPAINDPTTAVLAIDQVHRLLRMLGKRALRGEVIADGTGAPRLIFRTPNWEDYVHIACNEIRACGGGSMQIMRRMRAMIENLLVSLPERRHPSLLRELRYLDLTIDEKFVLAEDRALARIADAQGLGGSTVIAGKDRS